MLALEIVLWLFVGIAGGTALAAWGRDPRLRASEEIDLVYVLVATSLGGGFALRETFLDMPFGAVLGAAIVLAVWAPLIALATSGDRWRLVRDAARLPGRIAHAATRRLRG
jgi:alpha-beta hydrolase superfamily lysophospholipase